MTRPHKSERARGGGDSSNHTRLRMPPRSNALRSSADRQKALARIRASSKTSPVADCLMWLTSVMRHAPSISGSHAIHRLSQPSPLPGSPATTSRSRAEIGVVVHCEDVCCDRHDLPQHRLRRQARNWDRRRQLAPPCQPRARRCRPRRSTALGYAVRQTLPSLAVPPRPPLAHGASICV